MSERPKWNTLVKIITWGTWSFPAETLRTRPFNTKLYHFLLYLIDHFQTLLCVLNVTPWKRTLFLFGPPRTLRSLWHFINFFDGRHFYCNCLPRPGRRALPGFPLFPHKSADYVNPMEKWISAGRGRKGSQRDNHPPCSPDANAHSLYGGGR